MSRAIQATSKEVSLRVEGHAPVSTAQVSKHGDANVYVFSITEFRHLPLDEFSPIEIAYDLGDGEDYALLVVKNEGEVSESNRAGSTITFRWTPQNYVGDYELTLTTFNRKTVMIKQVQFLLKITPWKVHEDDFFHLYNDLRERHLQIYNLISPASIEEARDRRTRSNLFEQAKFIEQKITELENIVFSISQNPKKKVVSVLEKKLLHEAYGIDYHTLLDLARSSEELMPAPAPKVAPHLQQILRHKRTHLPYLPEAVIAQKTEISYDVFENRFLKGFLFMLTELLALYRRTVARELLRKESGHTTSDASIQQLKKILFSADDLKKRVSLMLNYPFLQEVQLAVWLTHITPTLEREVNYRRLYALYQDFLWSPFFQTSDIFKLGIKDLPSIYEYWCILFVCESLLELTKMNWNLKSQNLYAADRLGFAFSIRRRGPLLTLSRGPRHVTIYYQRIFSHKNDTYFSYTHPQKPDLTIEVTSEDSRQLLVFDPKYRYSLQFAEDPESAINKMHVYKDSIRDRLGNKVILNAFVLYPGKVEQPLAEGDLEFKVGASEKIGAIALRPTSDAETESRKERLLGLIRDLI